MCAAKLFSGVCFADVFFYDCRVSTHGEYGARLAEVGIGLALYEAPKGFVSGYAQLLG